MAGAREVTPEEAPSSTGWWKSLRLRQAAQAARGDHRVGRPQRVRDRAGPEPRGGGGHDRILRLLDR